MAIFPCLRVFILFDQCKYKQKENNTMKGNTSSLTLTDNLFIMNPAFTGVLFMPPTTLPGYGRGYANPTKRLEV